VVFLGQKINDIALQCSLPKDKGSQFIFCIKKQGMFKKLSPKN